MSKEQGNTHPGYTVDYNFKIPMLHRSKTIFFVLHFHKQKTGKYSTGPSNILMKSQTCALSFQYVEQCTRHPAKRGAKELNVFEPKFCEDTILLCIRNVLQGSFRESSATTIVFKEAVFFLQAVYPLLKTSFWQIPCNFQSISLKSAISLRYHAVLVQGHTNSYCTLVKIAENAQW